ncbi:MAG: hypothetical protein LBQ54_15255 [Planctomycetaceae bacterium]|nr:hypothetical protein [Planctomycetaceae bacterium]
MPSATNARALDPGRLTLTSFGSPQVGKSSPLEAEGNCGEAACFPPAGRDAAAGGWSYRSESHGLVRVAHWNQPAKKRFQQIT